jgi:hypothetical protein
MLAALQVAARTRPPRTGPSRYREFALVLILATILSVGKDRVGGPANFTAKISRWGAVVFDRGSLREGTMELAGIENPDSLFAGRQAS